MYLLVKIFCFFLSKKLLRNLHFLFSFTSPFGHVMCRILTLPILPYGRTVLQTHLLTFIAIKKPLHRQRLHPPRIWIAQLTTIPIKMISAHLTNQSKTKNCYVSFLPPHAYFAYLLSHHPSIRHVASSTVSTSTWTVPVAPASLAAHCPHRLS